VAAQYRQRHPPEFPETNQKLNPYRTRNRTMRRLKNFQFAEVPEPSAVVLLLLGGVAALGERNRRNS
jgi:hypothetical protein